MFLLGIENIVGGVAIVVVVCGEMCDKIEKLSDWNKICVVVDIDPHDYDSGDKKAKKTKRPPRPLQELEQGGQRPPKF